MRLLTFRFQTEPGFRLNLTDLVFLVAVGLASWWCREPLGEHHLYLLPAYVGLSFFQFCNVFRIGNRMEMFWYPVFIAVAVFGLQRPEYLWLAVLSVCEPLKIALILHRMRAGGYRGVFHRALESAVVEPAKPPPREKKPWWNPDVTHGFRCAPSDGVAVGVGVAGAAAVYPFVPEFAAFILIVVGHFFLFCNVFWLHFFLELVWIAAFFVNISVWVALGNPDWISVLAVQTPFTVVLLAHCLLADNYHGIGCSWINPDGYLQGDVRSRRPYIALLKQLGMSTAWIERFAGRRLDDLHEGPG